MKKFLKTTSLLLMCALLLSACGNLQDSTLSSGSGSSSKSSVQTTSTSDSSSYDVLLSGGKYKTSAISGLTAADNSNQFNSRSFESGLMKLSKKQFSTNSYVFQEGQVLSASTVNNWLDRKTKKNPTGLNPKSNGSKAEDKRAPMYFQQMLEEDYLQKQDGKYKLAGMSIGIAMNKIDYYQKKQYGATYKTTISTEEQKEQGEKIAKEVVKRLRKDNKVGNIPIVVGLYSVAPEDTLVGGTYFQYAVSKSGDLGSWSNLDYKNQMLPTVNGDTAISSSDSDAFSNFKDHIQDYFPNLSGVTAQAHYDGTDLKSLDVTINTQFDGLAQVTSFTQFVQQSATKYLPSGADLDINIQTVDEQQSVVTRTNGKFYSHVYDAD
ncbi:CamS family sex pheromone protein [Companilactobacillus halodurans]|uniref:CamS family sex pheromone protein n=1 Tax=Companilactobacillus halodurans TaxID=2584183 RepID=A0A5P0ZYG1_9LACO|nr:CamS family sex pheromone protein [Companilactobacillus halodurans]MQS75912.1 CamS family sex pheromone protein [Companilactobacillus halodurans]MQS98079.1 CamS family sex pheromone protein [Companilactobacillus halodurans]